MHLLRRILRAFEQMVQVTVRGLIAPIRHPIGLALASLPWLALTIFINAEVASHRSWTPFLGFGGQGWRYEPYDHSLLLRLLQIFALALFAILWMRWVARRRPFDDGLRGVGERLMRVGFAVLKLAAVALLAAIAAVLAGQIAHSITDSWYGPGMRAFKLATSAIGIWLACSFASAFASAAIDGKPIGIRGAWRVSGGSGGAILLSVLAPLLLVAWLKQELLSRMGETVRTTFHSLVLDATPLWKFAWQADPVPRDLIVISALVTWLQLAWLLATLATAYRTLSSAHLSPEPSPSPPAPAAHPASS